MDEIIDDDFDLDDMIRAAWEKTQEVDCWKLAEIIKATIPEEMVWEVLTALIGDHCFALLAGEGKLVQQLDPRDRKTLEAARKAEEEERQRSTWDRPGPDTNYIGRPR
jgi:hypothetical protein